MKVRAKEMNNRLCSVAVLLCSLFVLAVGWRPYKFLIEDIRCTHRPELVSYFNCQVQHYNKSDRLSFEIKFTKPVGHSKIDLLLLLFQRNRAVFVLANITNIDGCDFLEDRIEYKILSVLRNALTKYTKLPKKCPFPADTIISAQNFTVSPEQFPPFLPDAKLQAHAKLYLKDELDAEAFVNGSIEAIKQNGK